MRSKGGKASVASRRARKTFRESLKLLLSGKIEKGTPLYKQAQQMRKILGVKGEPTAQDLIDLGVFKKAMKGDTFAATFIRDTIGEKPTETFEDVTPQSPFVLGAIPAELINKAKADHETRQKEN